jgi:hypothetical protein
MVPVFGCSQYNLFSLDSSGNIYLKLSIKTPLQRALLHASIYNLLKMCFGRERVAHLGLTVLVKIKIVLSPCERSEQGGSKF